MAAPAIGVRRRWAPGPSARLDTSHPMSLGLVAIGCGRTEYVGWPLTHNPRASEATPFGLGFAAASTTSDPAAIVMPQDHSTPFLVTFSAWVRMPAGGTGGQNGIIDMSDGGGFDGSGMGIGSGTYGTNGTEFLGLQNGSTWIASGFLIPDGWHHLVYVDNNDSISMYVDGKVVYTFTHGQFRSGNRVKITVTSPTGAAVGAWAVWSGRALSQQDVLTILADPFCMLRS